jgi:hypothetical protein
MYRRKQISISSKILFSSSVLFLIYLKLIGPRGLSLALRLFQIKQVIVCRFWKCKCYIGCKYWITASHLVNGSPITLSYGLPLVAPLWYFIVFSALLYLLSFYLASIYYSSYLSFTNMYSSLYGNEHQWQK